MRTYDWIFFDIGGVLLTNGWDRNDRAAVLAEFGVEREAFEARHRACYDDWLCGRLAAEEYLRQTVFAEPRSFAPSAFFQAICGRSQWLDDGARGILQELAASHRYLLGAMNNEARETNAYRMERFGLDQLFQVAFPSAALGVRKPDPAFFERVLELVCAPPERILFLDDREENILAARAAGIEALRYVGTARLREDLRALGVCA